MKFLIVDDNKQFRAYVRELILTKEDECRELDDGLNVNAVYKEFSPDWVLLDIRMKKMDGFTAAEQLKKNFPDARFAMVSDYADERFRTRAAKLGAAAFIAKENLFELQNVIHPTAGKNIH
jgi:two-component system, NarL family, response regulator DegU